MFNIKNPKKILNMLKMFGIKPDTVLEQSEALIVEQWVKWEIEAGSQLMVVLERKGISLKVGLYEVEENESLRIWKEYQLKDLEQFLNNSESELNNERTIDIEPTAIGTSNGAGANTPTGREQQPGGATTGTGTGAEPAGMEP